jgi:hypothetical protein
VDWLEKTTDFNVKALIVLVGFPVLVVAFEWVLMLPAILVAYVAVRLGGDPKLWGKALSLVALVPAGWAAFHVCRWIWPRSKATVGPGGDSAGG